MKMPQCDWSRCVATVVFASSMLMACTSSTRTNQTTVDETVASSPSSAVTRSAASLVLRGGVIYSGTKNESKTSGVPTAVAISGNQIVAVGSDQEMNDYIGDTTRVVELNGRLVVPGLIDSHIHAVSGADAAGLCTLADAELTIELMKPIIGACLADAPAAPDTWLLVVAVNPAALIATAKDFDSLVADRPAFFGGSDGHTGWVNSAGLKAAGITRETKDPEGGKVERDAKGDPTGKLIDAATGLVAALIPKPTNEQSVAATKVALKELSAVGITSIRDPALNDDNIAVYESLMKSDALPIRVAGSYVLQDMTKPATELAAQATAFVSKHPGSPTRLTVDQVKVFADGVIEAPTWTAAMIDPYLDADGKPTTNLGDLYYDPKLFNEQVAALHQAGISVHVHAIGDRAVRTALDAFEFSQAMGIDTPRTRDQIVHLQIVDPADYPRFAKNNVIANFQAEWAFREAYTVEALEPFMGKDRYSRVYPIKSVTDAGATVAGGSDWPVSGFSPFVAMQRAVTRRDNKEAQQFVPGEAVSIEQALAMYTTGSAAALPFGEVGSLQIGMLADLAVLSQNILTVDSDTIGETVSELTIMNGLVVHEKKVQ